MDNRLFIFSQVGIRHPNRARILKVDSLGLINDMNLDASISRVRRKRQTLHGLLQGVRMRDQLSHIHDATGHAGDGSRPGVCVPVDEAQLNLMEADTFNVNK